MYASLIIQTFEKQTNYSIFYCDVPPVVVVFEAFMFFFKKSLL